MKTEAEIIALRDSLLCHAVVHDERDSDETTHAKFIIQAAFGAFNWVLGKNEEMAHDLRNAVEALR
jgi:hypothetical protein